jgi:hypothetical protein
VRLEEEKKERIFKLTFQVIQISNAIDRQHFSLLAVGLRWERDDQSMKTMRINRLEQS